MKIIKTADEWLLWSLHFAALKRGGATIRGDVIFGGNKDFSIYFKLPYQALKTCKSVLFLRNENFSPQ